MADVTGALREDFGGKTYEFKLTARVIAKLQAVHGNNVAGLLDGTAGAIPNFGAVLDLVALSLQMGSKLSDDEAEEIADAMLMQDTEIVGRIIRAAFPDVEDAKPGKPRKPKGAA